MPLPDFNEHGDLPVGVHRASLDEVCARFASATPERRAATRNLGRIHQLALGTGKLQRFIIFGSYVTAKPDPNDVDVILVMCDDFEKDHCDPEPRRMFSHAGAADEFGASIFWVRPRHLLVGTVEEFLAHWQVKRDDSRRGIVEVSP